MNLKHCLNWKVIGGLAVVGVGIFIVQPALIGRVLPLLLLAACPLSMLLMMGSMGKMGKRKQAEQPAGAPLPTLDQHIAELKGQLSSMQAQQEALARELARLESVDAPVVHEATAIAGAADADRRGRS